MRLALFLLTTLAFGQTFEGVPSTCDAACQAWVAQITKAAAVIQQVPVVVSPTAAVSSSAAVPSAAGVTSCPTFYGAAASYSPYASPKTAGDGFVATLFPGLTCNPSALQAYSYTVYAESAIKSAGKWQIEQTITTGVAIPMRSIGKAELWANGTVGPGVSATNGAVKLSTTLGGFATIPADALGFKHLTDWILIPGYEKITGGSGWILGIAKKVKP